MKIKKQNLINFSEAPMMSSFYKDQSKLQGQNSMKYLYLQYQQADNMKKKRKHLLKIIDACYQNKQNQQILCEYLGLPFVSGPITLNEIPLEILQKSEQLCKKDKPTQSEDANQLFFVINYLKNIREYYYCWVIYFNQDLKIISLKLLKKEEVESNQTIFNSNQNIIGIFVGRGKPHQIQKSMKNIENICFKRKSKSKACSKMESIGKEGKLHAQSTYTIYNSTTSSWNTENLQQHKLKKKKIAIRPPKQKADKIFKSQSLTLALQYNKKKPIIENQKITKVKKRERSESNQKNEQNCKEFTKKQENLALFRSKSVTHKNLQHRKYSQLGCQNPIKFLNSLNEKTQLQQTPNFKKKMHQFGQI